MVAMVSPARGFFLAVPWVSRTKKRCGRRCPPSRPVFGAGVAKAALGFAPPPPAARLRRLGTKAPASTSRI